MSYTVLARRYRSRVFDEIVGQSAIARTLRNAIEQDRLAHAYLFCGTRGVGKTSMARIFAKALNATDDLSEKDKIAEAILRGEDLDVIEIDGASNRGVNEARELIANAGLSPSRSPYKIYIIDEVHMLTREAFNALLKTMEEPPAHVKFILATTEPHKVPATIQSRCQRFDFRPLTTQEIAGQLRLVLETEDVQAEEDVVTQVARLGNGSMRDALSILDRLLATGENPLTMKIVEQTLGLPDQTLVVELVDAMINGDAAETLQRGEALLATGATIEQACELLAEHFRNLMVVSTCGEDSQLLDVAAEARAIAVRQAEHFDPPGLVHLIALCDSVGRSSRGSTTARAIFDATLIRLCMSEHLADITTLLEQSSGGGSSPTSNSGQSRQSSTARRAPAAAGDRKKKAPAESQRRELNQTSQPQSSQRSDSPDQSPSESGSPRQSAGQVTEVKSAPQGSQQSQHQSQQQQSPQQQAQQQQLPRSAAQWHALVQRAGLGQSQQVRLEMLTFQHCDERSIGFALSEDGPRYLADPQKQGALVELIQQVVGRKLQVQITTPNAAEDPPPDEDHADAAREHPLVQEAIELFDASIVRIEQQGE